MAQAPTKTPSPATTPARSGDATSPISREKIDLSQIQEPPELDPAQMKVNIHGIPPAPHMASAPPPDEQMSDYTRAEMEAGRKALQHHQARTHAEHNAGKQAVAHRGKVTHES